MFNNTSVRISVLPVEFFTVVSRIADLCELVGA